MVQSKRLEIDPVLSFCAVAKQKETASSRNWKRAGPRRSHCEHLSERHGCKQRGKSRERDHNKAH
eukprot:1974010-Pleurochrysis_carterae.AAC.2